MRNQIKICSLGAAIVCAMVAPALAEAPDAQTSCIDMDEKQDAGRNVATLVDTVSEKTLTEYSIYAEPCDGVLYLIANNKRYAVNESWRLFEFKSAIWADFNANDRIVVVADYATGIGPTAGRIFEAEIVMQKTDDGWKPEVVTTREIDADEGATTTDTPRPIAFGEVKASTIETEEDYLKLTLPEETTPPPSAIDFNSERFVSGAVFLTSGSNTIGKVRVHRTERDYVVSYDVKSPPIGTMDIKKSMIFVILPKDGLPVRFAERRRGGDEGERVKARTGVIDRLDF